jgi:hypothetical protein
VLSSASGANKEALSTIAFVENDKNYFVAFELVVAPPTAEVQFRLQGASFVDSEKTTAKTASMLITPTELIVIKIAG